MNLDLSAEFEDMGLHLQGIFIPKNKARGMW